MNHNPTASKEPLVAHPCATLLIETSNQSRSTHYPDICPGNCVSIFSANHNLIKDW
uniref:Uncharacterized protein n=1 Tax=Candidatus Kentrum sp. LPFa TaxID=2126335 RepID=A0A450WEN4_9GAMM|nr:MAG: hypothetical protein BECKLPF1236B_GA0070989_10793 [Candidatus Kentron sp. LPFa]